MGRARKPETNAVVHQVVLEVRYNYGYTYFDRCGITINDLIRHHAGWSVDQASPSSGTIRNGELGASLTFSAEKAVVSFQQSPTVPELPKPDEMARISAAFSTTVLQNLGIEDVTRAGVRVWQLYGCESLAAAKAAVKDLGFVDLARLAQVGLTDLDEVSFTVRANRGGLRSRVVVSSAEQTISVDPTTVKQAASEPSKQSRAQHEALIAKLKAKRAVAHYPHYSMLVDIDTATEYPSPVTRSFLHTFFSEGFAWARQFAGELVGHRREEGSQA